MTQGLRASRLDEVVDTNCIENWRATERVDV
jgi:hypothetical protein